jgi:transposase
MSLEMLSRHLLIPSLMFKETPKTLRSRIFSCKTINIDKSCPLCQSSKVHVHQKTQRKIKDAITTHDCVTSTLSIQSTRYRCTNCKKTFVPTIPGIAARARCTDRLRKKILWACDHYADLKKVRKNFQMGNASIYHHYFKALNERMRHRVNKPWPKRLGIDEHGFNRNKQLGTRNFVTMLVDHNYKRPFELLPCRDKKTLIGMTSQITGRENVEVVTMDLSSTYRSYIQEMFPQACIVADHFHVVRLLHPAINKYRYEITDRNRKHPLRKMLLKKRSNLCWKDRIEIEHWLKNYPTLRELYWAKEKMHTLYQTKGHERAKRVLENLIESLKNKHSKRTENAWQNIVKLEGGDLELL